MIKIQDVTQTELDQLLAETEQQGAGIHTTITRTSATAGVIEAHPSFGIFHVTVKSPYELQPDGTLVVSPDHGESQVADKLIAALSAIRGGAPVVRLQ